MAAAIFPRCRNRKSSPYRRNRERHARIKTHQLRARARTEGAAPARLDPDQRLAQIEHAVAAGWQPWEIAQLVPAPVTDDERARHNR